MDLNLRDQTRPDQFGKLKSKCEEAMNFESQLWDFFHSAMKLVLSESGSQILKVQASRSIIGEMSEYFCS
ncbi:MAG: hypothetical protein ONB37_14145 [candidate division KSB1 bacterium]|nr:hypothetical protein [candidate division KSB1 bacterium]